MRTYRESARTMCKPRSGLFAAVVLSGVFLMSGSAAALPTGGLAAFASDTPSNVENVLWVCGRHRCWWVPPLAYYPPPPFVVYRYRPHWWHHHW